MMINDKRFIFKQNVSPLKQIREKLDMSREQFAVVLGTTANTVYRWETGRHSITFSVRQFKNLRQIIKPLGIDIEDLPDDLGPHSIVD